MEEPFELKLVKKDFADGFLSIISKAVDVASLKVTKEGMYVICNKPDTSIILLGKYNHPIDVATDFSLNIGDIKKFLRVLETVNEEELVFQINSNSLKYKSKAVKFQYHFLDDSIVPKVTTKKEKLDALTLDTFFDIEFRKLQDVLKASAFATESNKVYIFAGEDGVCCELGDHERANADNIVIQVADGVEGQPLTQVIPFNLDIFRVLAGVKFDKARIGINLTHKVLMFYVKPSPEIEFKFIISGLTK
jgi:hypothetical protein